MSGWRVAPGTQVNVEGVVYPAGETLPELDDATVQRLVNARCIETDAEAS